MANFDNQQLTDGGWDALSNALAGKTLRFTRMVAGDGFLPEDADLAHATELVNFVMDIPMTGMTEIGGGRATVNGTLVSSQVAVGFFLRELGLICTLDNGPEILYSVNNAGEQADYVPAGYEQTAVVNAIEVHIVIGKAENIEINIGEGGEMLRVENVGDPSVGPGLFLSQAGPILQFKRLAAAAGITLTDHGESVAIAATAIPLQSFSGFIITPTAGIYTIDLSVAPLLGYRIVQFSGILGAGTATVSILRNGIAIVGATSINLTTAISNTTLSVDVSQNDKIDLSVTAVGSPANLAFSMRIQP